MKEKFEEIGQIKNFLEKGMFDNENVEKLVVKEGDSFLVFDKFDILDIFESNLKVVNSVGGHGIDDINLDGQKTIMKYKQNIVELEIRNDQSIYRQVRFNMKRQKAIELFKDKTKKINSPNDRVLYFEKH
jgi:methionine aminopeptidase